MYLALTLSLVGVISGYIYGKRVDDSEFIKQTFPSKYMYISFLGFYGLLAGILCDTYLEL